VLVFQAMPAGERLHQHLCHRGGGAGRDHRPQHGRRPRQDAQGRALPAMAQRRIKRRHLQQGRAGAAERQRQGGIGTLRQARRGAGALQGLGEAKRPDPVQQGHRRQVEGQAQRLGRRDTAGEAVVEILRRIGTEAERPARPAEGGCTRSRAVSPGA
jgi:hypothetical protein